MYKCKYCPKTYSQRQGVYRHQKLCIRKDNPVSSKQLEQIVIKPKLLSDSTATTKSEMAELREQVAKLTDAVTHINAATSITTNITNNINNINIYFNKDLKYYPELVKIMGKKGTCDYLLFTMPESKDIFGVLDKLFIRDGVNTCPIRISDGEFIIARSENQFDTDPTGELIDKENKHKLQDAVLSAYIDSTKQMDEACDGLRLKRVNGEYTEEDIEIINKRFDAAIEPSRPYDVIEIMNGIKPKKKDFDRLRRICPKIVKK